MVLYSKPEAFSVNFDGLLDTNHTTKQNTLYKEEATDVFMKMEGLGVRGVVFVKPVCNSF